MKLLATIITIVLMAAGCGTPQKGLWKYQSGAEAFTTEKPHDSAVIKTDFGRIRLQPFSVNNAYGFVVKVWIENNSDKPVSYKYSDFKIQNQAGEILDALDEGTVRAAVDGSVSNAAVIAGGSYGMQAGVAADMWRQVKAQMLITGEVPSNATKSGSIFFTKSAAEGPIRFRISNLVKPEGIVYFSGAK